MKVLSFIQTQLVLGLEFPLNKENLASKSDGAADFVVLTVRWVEDSRVTNKTEVSSLISAKSWASTCSSARLGYNILINIIIK